MLIALLFITALVALAYTIKSIDYLRGNLAPYIRTPKSVLGQINDSLRIKPGDVVCDVGCGDARVLLYCARRNPKAMFIGIESEIVPFVLAKINTIYFKNIHIKYGDALKQRSVEANKIFLYLLPDALELIRPKINKGSSVVCLEFKFKNKKADSVIKIKKPGKFAHFLYSYQF